LVAITRQIRQPTNQMPAILINPNGYDSGFSLPRGGVFVPGQS
jgi:hypothetical protein